MTPARLAHFLTTKASAVLTAGASWRPRPGSEVTLTFFALRASGVADMAYPNPPQAGFLAANMSSSCNKKKRAIRGPNLGWAYNIAQPCRDDYYWNEVTQTCDPQETFCTGIGGCKRVENGSGFLEAFVPPGTEIWYPQGVTDCVEIVYVGPIYQNGALWSRDLTIKTTVQPNGYVLQRNFQTLEEALGTVWRINVQSGTCAFGCPGPE